MITVSAAATTTVAAESRTPGRLLGVLDDATGQPVAGAEVVDLVTNTRAVTPASGAISLAWRGAGTVILAIQRIGYTARPRRAGDVEATPPATRVLRSRPNVIFLRTLHDPHSAWPCSDDAHTRRLPMMKRASTAVLFAFAVTACSDGPSAPTRAARAPQTPSFAVISNTTVDLSSLSSLNSCGTPPELVKLSGDVHALVKQNGPLFEAKINWADMKGVGATTGDLYVAQANQELDRTLNPPPGTTFTETVDVHSRLISKGGGDNLDIVVHETFTFPPFSLISLTIDRDCRG